MSAFFLFFLHCSRLRARTRWWRLWRSLDYAPVGAPLEINYYAVTLHSGDMLLMCSDGLHGVVEHAHIEAILRDGEPGQPLQQKCQELIEAARAAGGPDNITAALLRAE